MKIAPRALIVEDDRSWQQILSEQLVDAGLQVDLAEDLPTALGLISGYSHRLAVVDLSLESSDAHNRDGLQVLSALQQHDPACVAILLSGFATVELAVSALTQLGAFTCLRKEMFQRSEFNQIIRQVLTTPPAVVLGHPAISENSEDHKPEDPAKQPLAVLVVEDDAGWRNIYEELVIDAGFHLRLCGSYGEALGWLQREAFAVAVVDLSLVGPFVRGTPLQTEAEPPLDGFRLLAILRERGIPAVVVSGAASPDDIERAYEEEGIFAFLEKQTFDRRTFVDTLQAAVRVRQSFVGFDRLTSREKEVLQLLAQGLTNKEIAELLVITPNTVKRHLKAIFEKLDLHTRSAAAALAAGWPGLK